MSRRWGWAAALTLALLPQGAQGSGPEPGALVFRSRVEAPPARVWAAWTDPGMVTSWFAPAARVEARPGGPYELFFEPHAPEGERGGEGNVVLALEAGRLLRFTWNAPVHFPRVRPQRTTVTVRLEPLGEGATGVELIHDGWGPGTEWAAAHAYFADAWPLVLARLHRRFAQGPRDWTAPDGTDPAPVLTVRGVEPSLLPAPPGFREARLIVLRPGPQLAGATDAEVMAAQMRHGALLMGEMQAGRIVLAGPLVAAAPGLGDAVALAVFHGTAQEARELMARDASVEAGYFTAEILDWWVPPAPMNTSGAAPPAPRPVDPGGAAAPPPTGAPQAAGCAAAPGYDALDFWVGEWSVQVDGAQVGRNRIAPILGGCALVEEWVDASGGEGRSLFYRIPALGEWRQVWVTPSALQPGGVKEKREVEAPDATSVRFQGSIPLANGGSYLDRTTLTPLEGGRVRQHIEISTDGGTTWRTTFDAVYVPVEGSA